MLDSKLFKILCITIILVLSGCQTKPFNDSSKFCKEGLLLYKFDDINKKMLYSFEFLDCQGNKIDEEKISLNSDIGYSYSDILNKKLYLFGTDGLFELDLINNDIKALDKSIVTVLSKRNDIAYYVSNKGFLSTGGYNAEVNILANGEVENLFDLDFSVGSIEIDDEFIYLSNIPLFDEDEAFVLKYSFDTESFVVIDMPQFGVLQNKNNRIFYLTSSELIDIESMESVQLPVELSSPYQFVDIEQDIIIYDYIIDSSKCIIASETNSLEIEKCSGYYKTFNGELLFAIDDNIMHFNTNEFKLEDTGIIRDDLWRYYIIGY